MEAVSQSLVFKEEPILPPLLHEMQSKRKSYTAFPDTLLGGPGTKMADKREKSALPSDTELNSPANTRTPQKLTGGSRDPEVCPFLRPYVSGGGT